MIEPATLSRFKTLMRSRNKMRIAEIPSARNKLRVLGINSGTSADGIDLALIDFALRGGRPRIEYLAGACFPYLRRIKRELEAIIGNDQCGREALARFDIAFGHFLGKTAAHFISQGKHRVDLIASHGQTVGHYPRKEMHLGFRSSATLQIGDGNALAAATGLPVVSDFRRADVVLGGEGAPLTPFVNQLLFGDNRVSRIIVNIGGIANFSYHPAGGSFDDVRGGDCGPGNRLLDLASQLIFKRRFDRDGILAARGRVISEVLKILEVAGRSSTISTGREQYDELFLARLVHQVRRVRANYFDLMASLTAGGARLIGRSLKSSLRDKKLEAVYLTGGGRKNLTLVQKMMDEVRPVPVRPVEALGFDGDLLEAVSFAVLGGCFILGRPSTLPSVTGAAGRGVAGKLSFPPVTGGKRGRV